MLSSGGYLCHGAEIILDPVQCWCCFSSFVLWAVTSTLRQLLQSVC